MCSFFFLIEVDDVHLCWKKSIQYFNFLTVILWILNLIISISKLLGLNLRLHMVGLWHSYCSKWFSLRINVLHGVYPSKVWDLPTNLLWQPNSTTICCNGTMLFVNPCEFLKMCSKFTGEHPCRSVISVKLQSSWGGSFQDWNVYDILQ